MFKGMVQIESNILIQQTALVNPVCVYARGFYLYLNNIEKYCKDNEIPSTSFRKNITPPIPGEEQIRSLNSYGWVQEKHQEKVDLFTKIRLLYLENYRYGKTPHRRDAPHQNTPCIVDNYRDRTIDIVCDMKQYSVDNNINYHNLCRVMRTTNGSVEQEFSPTKYHSVFSEVFSFRTNHRIRYIHKNFYTFPPEETQKLREPSSHKTPLKVRLYNHRTQRLHTVTCLKQYAEDYDLNLSSLYALVEGKVHYSQGVVVFENMPITVDDVRLVRGVPTLIQSFMRMER